MTNDATNKNSCDIFRTVVLKRKLHFEEKGDCEKR